MVPEAAPSQPKTGREFAALEKAKHDAREAKRELKRVGESVSQYETRLKAESDARAATEAKLAELQKQMDAFKASPFAHLPPDQAERAIRDYAEGETPEKRTRQEIAEARRIAEEAKKELADAKAEYAEAARKGQEERQAQARAAQVAGFARAVSEGESAKTYAYLNAMHSPAEIRAMAAEIQEWAESEGKTFTFDQVASHLDKRAKTLYEERKERLLALAGTPNGTPAAGLAPPIQTGRSGDASAGNGHRGNGPGAGATPQGRGNQRRVLTREQEQEEDLAALRKATAKDRAARDAEAKAAAKQH